MPQVKKEQWPRGITVRNSTVRVYRTANARAKGGFEFVVTWSGMQGRKRQSFTDEARAMREARIRADQLNSGDVQAMSMRAHEREEWAGAGAGVAASLGDAGMGAC